MTIKINTGKEKILINTIASWAGQLVFVIAGFILPRQIDEHIGQEMLGIWDMCWSFVNYIALIELGIGSSVNRYVAKYRANNSLDKLNVLISSVFIIQFFIAIITAVLITSVIIYIPIVFLSDMSVEKISDVQYVVGFLGVGLVAHIMFETSRGILTGHHDWILHNVILSISHALAVTLMIISLYMGGSILHIAAIYGLTMLLSEITRTIVVFLRYRDLEISYKKFSLSDSKKIFNFGFKTFLIAISPVVLLQSTSLIIAYKLSPAVLAVFARPVALMRHLETFVNKFAFILTPTVSSLKSLDDKAQMKKFIVRSSAYSLSITLPAVVVLCAYGDYLMSLWMGDEYVNYQLILILAVGYLLPVSQKSSIRILIGLNMHGSLAYIIIAVSAFIFISMLSLASIFEWDLLYIATSLVISQTIAGGLIVVISLVRYLEINYYDYLKSVFMLPVLCNLVFLFTLLAFKHYVELSNNWNMLIGLVIGCMVLTVLYKASIFKDFRLRKTKKVVAV